MQPIAKIPYPDLNNPTGNNPLANVARAVRDAFCSAGPTPLSQQGAPLQWVRDGIRSGLGCPTPPDSPSSPQRINDPRGKCAGIRYRIELTGGYEQLIGGNWLPRPWSRSTQAWGPIGAIERTLTADGNSWVYKATVGANSVGTPQPDTQLFDAFANKAGVVRNANYSIDISPETPGQIDSCPNPAPTYPPAPTRDNPVGFPPIIFPPIIYVPISPSVNVPVTISPNFTINAGINFRVADSIDIQFGPDAVNIYINPDSGIDIFPDAPAPGYELPPGYPDDPTGNAGNDGASGECPDVDLEPVIDKLNQLLGCACDDDSNFEFVSDLVASANNGTILLSDNVIAVRLTITEFPTTPKSEWGGGDAPDVFYAGWASFSGFGGQGQRSPIDYREKLYRRSPNDAVFTWTCRQFYSADIAVVRRLPVTPP